jgi:GR25 family glycosyltransferase involved in LPS biosynthesis|tara:strand:+ start:2974 stop:3777 length:804 start_codon:yes stop_codon:yes gene_type:complete
MKSKFTQVKNNTKIFCIICFISVLILLWSLSYNNIIEKFDNKQNLLNQIFDKIYVINLNQDIEKKNIIDKKLKELNIDYSIFEAVDGKKLKNIKLLNYGSVGAVGCRLSHMKILEDAVKNNYNRILVFEDDIIFRKDFNKHLEQQYLTIKNNNVDWKLLYLGCSYHVLPKNIKNNVDYVETMGNTSSAFAVGIHKDIYNVILNNIKNTNKVYDDILAQNIQPNYKSIVFNPQIVSVIVSNKSSTDNKIRNQKKYMEGNLLNIDDFNL